MNKVRDSRTDFFFFDLHLGYAFLTGKRKECSYCTILHLYFVSFGRKQCCLLGVSRRYWYQIVAYPGDFALLVFFFIKNLIARHVFCSPVDWNEGCWGVRIRPRVVSSIRKNN